MACMSMQDAWKAMYLKQDGCCKKCGAEILLKDSYTEPHSFDIVCGDCFDGKGRSAVTLIYDDMILGKL